MHESETTVRMATFSILFSLFNSDILESNAPPFITLFYMLNATYPRSGDYFDLSQLSNPESNGRRMALSVSSQGFTKRDLGC
jgi:hypothetical protein